MVAEREHEDWSVRTYWPGLKKKKKQLRDSTVPEVPMFPIWANNMRGMAFKITEKLLQKVKVQIRI